MRRRLILSTALIALAAVIVLGVPLALVDAARLRQDSTGRLEREADAVAGAIDDRLEHGQPVSATRLRAHIPKAHRITVETRGGRRIVSGPPLQGETLRAHAGAALGGSVIAEAPVGELDHRVHRAWLLIAALSLGGVLTAVALAALQARRLARPLEAIARRSVQLGDGDFSTRAGHYGVPEIDAIAQGLDSSAGRIAELVAREREFSANVSHQLRTPLTALRLRLEQAADEDDEEARARGLEAALREADRLEVTIADLLALRQGGERGRERHRQRRQRRVRPRGALAPDLRPRAARARGGRGEERARAGVARDGRPSPRRVAGQRPAPWQRPGAHRGRGGRPDGAGHGVGRRPGRACRGPGSHLRARGLARRWDGHRPASGARAGSGRPRRAAPARGCAGPLRATAAAARRVSGA
jgi:hypothetical protein